MNSEIKRITQLMERTGKDHYRLYSNGTRTIYTNYDECVCLSKNGEATENFTLHITEREL